MKPLFGDYLVNKNVVSPEQLLSALREQARLSPSYVEVAVEEKILSTEQLLSALRHQAKTNCSFIDACKKLNLWTAEVEKQFSKSIQTKRPPLGQILTQNGALDANKLIELLDEYLNDEHAGSDNGAAAGAGGDLTFAPVGDPRLLNLYISYLDPQKFAALKSLAADTGRTSELVFEVQALLGFTELIHLPLSSSLLKSVEKNPGADTGKVVETLWQIRAHLQSGKDEKSFWEQNREALKSLLKI